MEGRRRSKKDNSVPACPRERGEAEDKGDSRFKEYCGGDMAKGMGGMMKQAQQPHSKTANVQPALDGKTVE